jgi:hypothetical protein
MNNRSEHDDPQKMTKIPRLVSGDLDVNREYEYSRSLPALSSPSPALSETPE